MSTTTIEQLQEQVKSLKLHRLAEELPALLQEASKRELSYTEFLREVVSQELAARQERHTHMKTVMARFPFPILRTVFTLRISKKGHEPVK